MSAKCLLIVCVQPALPAKNEKENRGERRLSSAVVNRVPHSGWCSRNAWWQGGGSTQATCLVLHSPFSRTQQLESSQMVEGT